LVVAVDAGDAPDGSAWPWPSLSCYWAEEKSTGTALVIVALIFWYLTVVAFAEIRVPGSGEKVGFGCANTAELGLGQIQIIIVEPGCGG
jgi:hypothetical protein